MKFLTHFLFIMTAFVSIPDVSADEQLTGYLCQDAEHKHQYAVIEENKNRNFSTDGNVTGEWIAYQLTPYFIAKRNVVPNTCEILDLVELQMEFPILKEAIDQYLQSDTRKSKEEPLIVWLPPQLHNSEAVQKVRPAILATSITFAILWLTAPSYLAHGCLFVFITCAFRPEQCQEVLSNFYEFFAELYKKGTKTQATPMGGAGHKLGQS